MKTKEKVDMEPSYEAIIERYQVLHSAINLVETRLYQMEALSSDTSQPIKDLLLTLRDEVNQTLHQLLSDDGNVLAHDAKTMIDQIRLTIDKVKSKLMENLNEAEEELESESIQRLNDLIDNYLLDAFNFTTNPFVAQEIKPDWRVHSTPLQQRELLIDPKTRDLLESALSRVNELRKTDQLEVDCFICYAWPTRDRFMHENWVQPFLLHLSRHLHLAGIRTYLDIDESRYGYNAYEHMDIIKRCDVILLIGTDSLVDQFHQEVHAVRYVWDLIQARKEALQLVGRALEIIPLSLTNDYYERPFPADVPGEIQSLLVSTPANARDLGYAGHLERLLRELYRFQNHPGFQKAWGTLIEHHSEWFKHMEQSAVEKYFSNQAYLSLYRPVELKERYVFPPTTVMSINRFPEPNKVFTGRESKLDLLAEWFCHNDRLKDQACALVGLGGVGKTQLALEFALRVKNQSKIKNHQLYYDALVCLSATDITNEWKRFARNELKLDLSTHEESIRPVYEALAKRYHKVLIIFDDVFEPEELNPFLPNRFTNDHFSCHVLVTSRNPRWNDCKTIQLNSFTPDEASYFINETLRSNTIITKDEQAIKELIRLTHGFPIMLSQALARITGAAISIERYNTMFQESQRILMDRPPIQQYRYEYPIRIFKSGQTELAEKGVKNITIKTANTLYESWKASLSYITDRLVYQNCLMEKFNSFLLYLTQNAKNEIQLSEIQAAIDMQEHEFQRILENLLVHSLIDEISDNRFSINSLLKEFLGFYIKELQLNSRQEETPKKSDDRVGLFAQSAVLQAVKSVNTETQPGTLPEEPRQPQSS